MPRSFCLLAAALCFFAGCSRTEPTYQYVSFNLKQPPTQSTQLDPPDGTIPPPRLLTPKLTEESLARGVAYLVKQQSTDGAWRSDVYATFKDGTALTPLVLCVLQDAADAGVNPDGSAEARKKAVAWLAKFAKPDGTIDAGPDGFEYPVYTAALAVRALSRNGDITFKKARDAWLKYLKERQLTDKLGWKPEDKQYGGWGYCRVIPRKPEPGKFAPPLIESNLSATVFALEALKSAGELGGESEKAAVFIRRCQNEDGGFHFIYDDPTRNKAGSPDTPGSKAARFHSYGSTTADGLRALALCGLPEDTDRRATARVWLQKHFRADSHPGEYVKAHEPNREAVYYYYAASVAKALRDMKVEKIGGMDWAAELASALKKRQHEDGSWVNPIELVRENEPIVATCSAVTALAKCKK